MDGVHRGVAWEGHTLGQTRRWALSGDIIDGAPITEVTLGQGQWVTQVTYRIHTCGHRGPPGSPCLLHPPPHKHGQGHPIPELLDVEVRDFVLETCSLPDLRAVQGPSVWLPLKTIHAPMSLGRSVCILKE